MHRYGAQKHRFGAKKNDVVSALRQSYTPPSTPKVLWFACDFQTRANDARPPEPVPADPPMTEVTAEAGFFTDAAV
jgi:hypothetical protein